MSHRAHPAGSPQWLARRAVVLVLVGVVVAELFAIVAVIGGAR